MTPRPSTGARTSLLLAAILPVCPTTFAGITFTNNVTPNTPGLWNQNVNGYIGNTANGQALVDGASILRSRVGYLGFAATSTGEATITGAGSKWENGQQLYMGYSGTGLLDVTTGGFLISSASYLGHLSGSHGSATVTGAGSRWTNTSTLVVGNSGSGSLSIQAGGLVSNTAGSVALSAGSVGTVSVADAGSKWASGQSLDVGYAGTGSLTISSGAQVSNTTGTLGYLTSSSGTATVNGPGSTWANTGELYVGRDGAGSLTVADGGEVTVAQTIWAPLDSLHGNGTISAKGAVLDGDALFGTATGTQVSFGSGGTLALDLAGAGHLGVGYKNTGTLTIAEGISVTSADGYLGYATGSNGTVTVTGAASAWTTQANLLVGRSGNGDLTIANGAVLTSESAALGDLAGATGTTSIVGTGSRWLNTGSLLVGRLGTGSLTVSDGGDVTVGHTLWASLADIHGNGNIAAEGAVLDGSMSFTPAVKKLVPFGTGGTLQLHLRGLGDLGIGYKGMGSLTLTDGLVISSIQGHLGYDAGSTGTATLTGAGTKWTNSSVLSVGVSGTGSLTVSDGAQVSSTEGFLGRFAGATGTAQVTGSGSQWTNSSNLDVGLYGNGTLSIRQGGEVTNAHSYVGTHAGGTGDVTVSDPGSTWTSSGTHYIGYNGNGSLAVAAGAKATARTAYFGYTANTQGALAVRDSLSLYQTDSDTVFGFRGKGTLIVENAAEARTGSAVTGYDPASEGSAAIAGSGSMWYVSGYMTLGRQGSGSAAVSKGAKIETTHPVTLASMAGSTGTLFINGAGSQLYSGGELTVGAAGNATMSVEDGGYARNSFGYIGRYAGTGEVIVTGTGSRWQNTQGLKVGDVGRGSLRIESGGNVGSYEGAVNSGSAIVTGAGSQWFNSYDLRIGESASASLSIQAGASVINRIGTIGSEGSVTVSGAGSQWKNSMQLFVSPGGGLTVSDGGEVLVPTIFAPLANLHGNGRISANGAVLDADMRFEPGHPTQIPFGTSGILDLTLDSTGGLGAGYRAVGSLLVADGATISSAEAYLGYAAGAVGTGRVTGAGSHWNTGSSPLYVGRSGAGSLLIEHGGQMSIGSGYTACETASTGTVQVTGSGSVFTTAALHIGYRGTGTMEIKSGAHVESTAGVTANAYLGYGSGSVGTVTVAGSNSRWNIKTGLFVGYSSGAGNLFIEDGAQVTARTLNVAKNSSLSMDVSGSNVLVLGDATQPGVVTNNGRINLRADAFAPSGVFSPITDLAQRSITWSGAGAVAATGGTWDQAAMTFTIDTPDQLAAGTTTSLASGRRVIITDLLSGWRVGASFGTLSGTNSFSATPAQPATDGELLGAWIFSTGVSGTDVLLAFDIGRSIDPTWLHVMHYDGSTWASYPTGDLACSAEGVASFTVSSFSGYALVAVPEPGICGLFAGVLLQVLARRRRHG